MVSEKNAPEQSGVTLKLLAAAGWLSNILYNINPSWAQGGCSLESALEKESQLKSNQLLLEIRMHMQIYTSYCINTSK